MENINNNNIHNNIQNKQKEIIKHIYDLCKYLCYF